MLVSLLYNLGPVFTIKSVPYIKSLCVIIPHFHNLVVSLLFHLCSIRLISLIYNKRDKLLFSLFYSQPPIKSSLFSISTTYLSIVLLNYIAPIKTIDFTLESIRTLFYRKA